MTGCVGGDEGITSLLQVQKDEGKSGLMAMLSQQ